MMQLAGARPSQPALAPRPAVEPDRRALRSVLGRYATGVAVVSTLGADGQPLGLTVNSFASVSLEPPLVLWSIREQAQLMPLFRDAEHWAISVLSAEQGELARRFCAPVAHRFDSVGWRAGMAGVPLLDGAIAWLQCSRWQCYPGGDHLVLLGRVHACVSAEGAPLVFHDGRFGEWQARP